MQPGNGTAKGDAVSSALAYADLSGAALILGPPRLMSWSAYDLQARAAARAATSGQPGFVPDGYLENLNDLGLQATITADELCAVGLWERTGGGYRLAQERGLR